MEPNYHYPPQPPVQPVPNKPRRELKRIFIPIGTGVLGIIIGAASSSGSVAPEPAAASTQTTTVSLFPPTSFVTVTTGPTKTVSVPAPPPKPVIAMPGDGTFEVNVDIQPGTYKSPVPDSGNCYWERSTGSDSLGSIIANDNSAGPSVVVIKKSDKFFTSSGCNPWRKA